MTMSHGANQCFICKNWIVLGLMAGIGGVLDIVKIRKTGSKTGQKQFRIFLLTFLNSLGQDGSNSTPFDAVWLILLSTHS